MECVNYKDLKNVLRVMRQAWPVTDESIAELCHLLTPCRFDRRELMVKAGIINGMAYFVESGMTRSYWLVDGEEITTSFTTDGSIVFSMDELYYGLKSDEYVEAVTPVMAYGISVDNLRRLFATRLDMANWGRVIHQNEYRRLHRDHKARLSLPAAERYEEFRHRYPEVTRQAQLGFIASYLGITLSTLSRLRNLT